MISQPNFKPRAVLVVEHRNLDFTYQAVAPHVTDVVIVQVRLIVPHLVEPTLEIVRRPEATRHWESGDSSECSPRTRQWWLSLSTSSATMMSTVSICTRFSSSAPRGLHGRHPRLPAVVGWAYPADLETSVIKYAPTHRARAQQANSRVGEAAAAELEAQWLEITLTTLRNRMAKKARLEDTGIPYSNIRNSGIFNIMREQRSSE